MIRHLPRVLACLALLALAGCAAVKLVEVGPQVVAKEFRVDTPVAWGRLDAGLDATWTLDGVTLNRLRFAAAIPDGRHIGTRARPGRSDLTGPYFRAGADATQVQQLLIDLFREAQAVDVRAENLAPTRIGAVDGFAFDLRYATAEGLIYRGRVLAAEHRAKLYFVYFVAPAEYYFDRDRALVDEVMASIRIVGSEG